MQMPSRGYANAKSSTGAYRYEFNGKEKDADMDGNNYDYGFRTYNPQIGKFLSVDPLDKKYAWYTPYQFAGDIPIWAVDIDGLDEWMSTQASLQKQRALLQQKVAISLTDSNTQQSAQAIMKQPVFTQADNSYYVQQRSNKFRTDA